MYVCVCTHMCLCVSGGEQKECVRVYVCVTELCEQFKNVYFCAAGGYKWKALCMINNKERDNDALRFETFGTF